MLLLALLLALLLLMMMSMMTVQKTFSHTPTHKRNLTTRSLGLQRNRVSRAVASRGGRASDRCSGLLPIQPARPERTRRTRLGQEGWVILYYLIHMLLSPIQLHFHSTATGFLLLVLPSLFIIYYHSSYVLCIRAACLLFFSVFFSIISSSLYPTVRACGIPVAQADRPH